MTDGAVNCYELENPMRPWLTIITVGWIFYTAVASAGESVRRSKCLPYEPLIVELRGVLIQRTFPGPPNYESIRKGDRAETSWLLDRPDSICVQEDKASP